MSSAYSLLVQSAEGILWKPGPLHRKKPRFYVVIFQDGVEIQRTHSAKGEPTPKWNTISTISVDSPSAHISLRLFHDSLLGDTCLCAADTDISTLVDLCGLEINTKRVVDLDLIGVWKKWKGRPMGTLSVGLMMPRAGAALVIEEVQKNLENLEPGGSTSASVTIGGVIEQAVPIASAIGPILLSVVSKLEIIVEIGDEITAIHPYANIAWKVLTYVYKAVKQQKETDEKLLDLVKTMDEVYSFVGDIDFLAQKIKSVEDKMLAILKQTVECALFIQEYTAHGFLNRAVRSTWNHAEKDMEKLATALRDLKRSFEGDLTVQSLFVSAKVLDVVERLDLLKKLNPVDMNATSRALCLSGTRRKILDDITEWLTVPSSTSGNILWLSGVAGSGKSTISTTIAESLRGLERLGGFLFFDRNDRARSHPDSVIRTIAYWLALSSTHLGSAISDAIRRDPAVVNAPLRTQFKELLLEPLQTAEPHIKGPIILILDALDECGEPDTRLALVSLLSGEFPKLPRFLRIFITSRLDSDIGDQFESRFHHWVLNAGSSSNNDVESFIRYEMTHMRGLNGPGEESIKALVELSGGLFIWASTAIKFLKSYRPNERLNILLSQHSTRGFTLDALYSVALRDSAPWHTDKEFAEEARAVLLCVVLGRVPMTDETIDMILAFEKGSSANVLVYLACVIEWTGGNKARTLHASFTDYLTDPTRSGGEPWSINPKVDNLPLSLGCLHILNSELQFNICRLENSHYLNVEVPDIFLRVTTNVSPQLAYSCCFWANHIQETPLDETVLQAVEKFMHCKALYWLEVLSLLGQVPIATVALGFAGDYAKDHNEDLEDFISDTIKFVATFAPVIIQSVPHIYLSALPFAPNGSRVAKEFGSLFPNTLQTQGPLEGCWPIMQKVLRGHTSLVTAVDFSPDSGRIISGAYDNTLRIWDTQTGLLVAGPLDGHIGGINTVKFSPDGNRIVSGSADKNLFIWDAQTGAPLSGPLEGHTKSVTCATFSPDGALIVSGSEDQTLHLWDGHTGAAISGPLEGHSSRVSSVHFSLDGTYIISGSRDTLQIWDAHTGTPVGDLLDGHIDYFNLVNFSPNHRSIVSVCTDHTEPIWNTASGDLISGPLLGHSNLVHSAEFSPDGMRIVSASHDGTIRIWDASTGALVSRPLEGHTNAVRSAKFSPDGAWIGSVSDDRTVRLWDAQAGRQSDGPVNGHRGWIMSVHFSPDGTHIACGSFDGTLCIWDAQSGALVIGPLEGHTRPVYCVDFSPDGTRIVSGSGDKTLCIWDATTSTPVGSLLTGHTSNLTSVDFSPDGTQIVSGSEDQTLRLWNARTGAVIGRPLEGHTGWVTSVNFSPDGMLIASGSSDYSLRIWDAHTGSPIGEPLRGHTWTVTSVQFSPDGTKIVSGACDKTLRIWDAQTGALLRGPLTGHTNSIRSANFSPDGTLIASGADDGKLRIWNAQTGARLGGPLEGHTQLIQSIMFSPDGSRIASGSFDKTLRIWEVREASTPINEFKDEWVLNAAGDLMFWVPPWRRIGLYMPRNTLVISADGTTELDLSRFVHGTEWIKCRDPSFRVL
ncbi:WD40 repeat-like protein [Mycena epipterygia]|nr:WD40 repeat-like protein [Mycena epipterygia]